MIAAVAILGSLAGEGGTHVRCYPSGQSKDWHGRRAGAQDQEAPIISDVEGFMVNYVVYAPDDTVTAISIFNDYAGAEELNRRALAWTEQSLTPLLIGPATAMAGPVIVHTLA